MAAWGSARRENRDTLSIGIFRERAPLREVHIPLPHAGRRREGVTSTFRTPIYSIHIICIAFRSVPIYQRNIIAQSKWRVVKTMFDILLCTRFTTTVQADRKHRQYIEQ